MDYGEGTAATIGGVTATNNERREQCGGESGGGPPEDAGSVLRDRAPGYLSERDIPRRRADERRGAWDLIDGVADEVERADVARVAAEYAPQSEGERQVVFQAIATHFIALRSAGEAMSGRHAPQVAALCTGDFVKASKLHASLQGTLQAMRPYASLPRTEIHGHVHLHAEGIAPMLVGGGHDWPSAAVMPALAPPDAPDAPDADASGRDLL